MSTGAERRALRGETGLTVGQTVTITPRVLFSADRDTEPGCQPWKAKIVGWTDTQVIIESDYPEPGGFRGIDRELVS